MLFKTAAVAASLAGLAIASPQGFNAGDGLVTTVTTFTTQEITITSCAPTVTNCPASITSTAYAVVTTIPVAAIAVPIVPSGATGTAGAGGAGAGGAGGAAGTYNMPAPTAGAGQNGGNTPVEQFTGAGVQLKAGSAVAVVAAAAALML